jgi:hypothetical protein
MRSRYLNEYCADFLWLFHRVIQEDGILLCTRTQINDFVYKYQSMIHTVTGITVSVPDAQTDVPDDLTGRNRLQEFIHVFSPAYTCYERIVANHFAFSFNLKNATINK